MRSASTMGSLLCVRSLARTDVSVEGTGTSSVEPAIPQKVHRKLPSRCALCQQRAQANQRWPRFAVDKPVLQNWASAHGSRSNVSRAGTRVQNRYLHHTRWKEQIHSRNKVRRHREHQPSSAPFIVSVARLNRVVSASSSGERARARQHRRFASSSNRTLSSSSRTARARALLWSSLRLHHSLRYVEWFPVQPLYWLRLIWHVDNLLSNSLLSTLCSVVF